MPRTQRGGLGQKIGTRRGTSTFSYLSHFAVFVFYSSGSRVPIQGNQGGREGPIEALVGHASIRPHGGGALVLIYPCGKAQLAGSKLNLAEKLAELNEPILGP